MPLKQLQSNPTYQLINQINESVLGIDQLNGKENDVVPLTHSLPNLMTTTDECSMFITSEEIKKKQVFFISIRPNRNNTSTTDNNRRDNYTTGRCGDLHLRGIRVVLNNTFTAGGRSAPIFACIYGLSNIEMPGNEIVITKVKGLVPASDINGSVEEGFILFIRGKYSPEDSNDKDTSTTTMSQESIPCKEARVAKIYREMVYYPLIHDIRVNHYDMDPNAKEIPTNLTAISWMDGCNGQLKLITQEEVLKDEETKKIISNKHSPARTAVEQAADVGPMFKNVRGNVKTMPAEKESHSPIAVRIHRQLNVLETNTLADNPNIVILQPAKRKAIIQGISKLPIAMGEAYSRKAIQSGFFDNGQLDKSNMNLPSIKSIVGTYRGPIHKDHCLYHCTSLIKSFYKEMYLTGRIEEKSFDEKNIVKDTDSNGTEISRDYPLTQEGYQRAKILSCKAQRIARIKLKADIKKQVVEKKERCIAIERKKYKENAECERRVSIAYHLLK